MRFSLRTQLFLASILLLSVVGLSSGAYLEGALRDILYQNIHQSLSTSANLSRQTIEMLNPPPSAPLETWDALADRLGGAAQARLTIIDKDGRVIGDSHLPAADLAKIENHSNRPEVIAALKAGVGQDNRHSLTVDMPMYYVALPFDLDGDIGGVARISTSVDDIEDTVTQFHQLLQIASLIGLTVAIIMSALASHLFSRTVSRLVQRLKAVVEGSEKTPLTLPMEHEFRGLAGSVNRMVMDMKSMVSTLADERNQFQNLLAVMREGIIVLDGEERIQLLNPAATQIFDLRSDKVGHRLLEVIRIPELYALIKEPGEPDEPRVTEFNVGTTTPRRILAQAVHPGEGDATVISLYDVTNMRKLERMRTDFLANVSHELRTPASIILLNSETLLDGAIDEREMAQSLLEAMMRNAQRLARLLSDLMDISRLESGQQRLELEEIDLAEVVDELVSGLQSVAAERQITLTNAVADSIEVVGDQKALDQIIHNLISNAIKYSNEGCQVHIRAMHEGNRVLVEVEDNGPGIAPRHQGRLFERFYRVDPGRSIEMGGTGLGLAIVKHLIGAMGGEVGMRSASPRGSIFWIRLQAPM